MPNQWNPPTVLVISDDSDFSRALTARLQLERTGLGFTLMGADLCGGIAHENFDAALIGPLQPARVLPVLTALEDLGMPVVYVCQDSSCPESLEAAQRGVIVLQREEGSLDTVVLVLRQVLKSAESLARAHRAEQEQAANASEAALGRYMLEMRHPVNNSLTSLLGNSDLLLSEPGALSASARAQVATIRSMALRIHEIFQRFSSLEKELAAIEQHSSETMARAVAGRA
jgi:signal transduction histidine kinase